MKRILLALPLFALTAIVTPSDAEAGLGFSAYGFGGEYSRSGLLYVSPFGGVPSIDWKDGGNYFQFHAMELIDGLARGEDWGGTQLNLGVNYYKTSGKKTISERVDGIVQYGATVDLIRNLDSEYTAFAPGFTCRAGAQAVGGMGIGIYVVPTIGIAYVDIDGGGDLDAEFGLNGGGTLQVSVWTK